MRNVSFARMISLSIGRTQQILFRPFRLKKWLMLGLITLLAGHLANAAFGLKGIPSGRFSGGGVTALPAEMMPADLAQLKTYVTDVVGNVRAHLWENTLFICTAPAALGMWLAVFLLWMYLQAVFSFVFIEAVVKDDTSVRIPYHRNKRLGSSYFLWNLFMHTLGLAAMGAWITVLIRAVCASGFLAGFPHCQWGSLMRLLLPYLFGYAGVCLFLFIVSALAGTFVQAVMYCKRVSVWAAWRSLLATVGTHLSDFCLFGCLQVVLLVPAALMSVLLYLVAGLLIGLCAALIALAGMFILWVCPPAIKGLIGMVMGIASIPLVVYGGFLVSIAVLPVPVFFRLFSLYFLGSVDQSCDLLIAPKPAVPEDVTSFDKPLRLIVWVFLLLIGAMIVSAVAIGSIVVTYARTAATRMQGMGPQRVSLPAVVKAVRPSSMMFRTDRARVTVKLKNGSAFTAFIEQEDERTVTFTVEGGTCIFTRDEIAAIESQEPDGDAAQTATGAALNDAREGPAEGPREDTNTEGDIAR